VVGKVERTGEGKGK
jgi:hypothetical protein